MREKFEYLFKNVGVLTISNFSSKILVFLLVPLYTSALTTAEYGTYDLMISFAQLMVPVLSANIAAGVMRYTMDKKENKKEAFAIGICITAMAAGLFAILVFITDRLNLIAGAQGLHMYLYCYFVVYLLNTLLGDYSKGKEDIKTIAIAGALGTISVITFNIVLLLILNMGLQGFFLANIVGLAIPDCYYIIKFRDDITIGKINKMLARKMLNYSIPLIFTTVGWVINNTADKYVVTLLCGVSATGLISVAYKIPAIVNTIHNIFISAWHISAVKEYGNSDAIRFYNDVLVYMNLMMYGAGAFLILLCKPIACVLFAKEFYTAWRYVPFLLISSIINSSSGIIGAILSAQKNSIAMARSGIIGIASNFLLNFVLIYIVGPQGATIATAISSLIMYIIRMKPLKGHLDAKYLTKNHISWGLLTLQAMVFIKEGWSQSLVPYLIQLVLILFGFVLYRSTLKRLIVVAGVFVKKKT